MGLRYWWAVWFDAEVQAVAIQLAILFCFGCQAGEYGVGKWAAFDLAAFHACIPVVQFISKDTRKAIVCEVVGERSDTRKPAQGGLSGVFSAMWVHVKTCIWWCGEVSLQTWVTQPLRTAYKCCGAVGGPERLAANGPVRAGSSRRPSGKPEMEKRLASA